MKTLIDTGRSKRGWSTLEAIGVCPRKYRYQQEAREEGTETFHSKATDLGTYMHVGMAHHYGQQLDSNLMDPVEAMAACSAARRMAITDPAGLDYGLTLFDAYKTYYSKVDTIYKPLAVEHEYMLNIDMGDGTKEQVSYRADLVVQDTNGCVFIIDHKTGSDKDVHLQYELSGQSLLAQHIGRSCYGEAFRGLIINHIRTARTLVTPQFNRHTLPYPSAAYLQFVTTLKWRLNEIRRWKDVPTPQVPQTLSTVVCMTRYGPCPYFARCTDGI